MRKTRILLVALCLFGVGCAKKKAPEPAAAGPCAPSAVTKGPWVLRATETSAKIVWESRESGCVEVGVAPESGGDERVVAGAPRAVQVAVGYGQDLAEVRQKDEVGAFFMNEIELGGLSAGTCYRYRLGDEERAGRLCTARAPGQPFSFIALGDSAVRWKDAQKVVAQAVSQPSDFTLHTGDIQYYASLLESWQEWMGEMAPLLRHGAFAPSIGNHEDEIEGEFQNYYARLFEKPGQTDTSRWYRFASGGVHFFSLDTESPLVAGSEQLQWLQSELQVAGATAGFRFSVAYFHKPIWTLGRHAPLMNVRAALEPLFTAHGVKLVLMGHNHSYERFEKDGITYVVTGGGGAPLYDVNESVGSFPNDVPFRQAAASAHHFMRIDVGQGSLKGQAIGPDGGVIDSFEHPVP